MKIYIVTLKFVDQLKYFEIPNRMANVGEIPSEGYENEEQFFMKTEYIVMLSMIWVFILSASIIEHLHFGYIHETGVVIIIGVCISLISKFWGYNEMNAILEFNENIFLCLTSTAGVCFRI